MKPNSARPRRPGALLPILAATAPAALALSAQAQITNWVGPAGTGDWNVAANWSTGAVPGSNATVRIRNADAVDRTVNYNYTGPSVTYGAVLIAQIGGGTNTNTLSLAANRLNTTDMYVGHTGPGIVVQSGGTNSVSGSLFIGYNDGYGEYRLSGGWLFGSPLLGTYGNASFKHTGGTVTNGILDIQAVAGRAASYELSGTGELRESQITLSGPGSATFTQTAGLTVTNQFTVGGSSGSATATVSGGTFSAFGQTIGAYSDGVFNHTGGASTGSTIFIGSSGGHGTYNLSGSATLSRTNSAVLVGSSGDGTFNQSGGSLDTSLLRVGSQATGTYNHTAGPARVTTLELGYGTSGAGVYNLSGTGGLVSDTATIGVAGNATFNHSGGTNWVSSLTVAASNNRASYTLSDTGGLHVTSLLTLGRAGGNATFTQTGGTSRVSNSVWVGDGQNGFASGQYALTGGELTVDRRLEVGRVGATGTFDHSGGTNTAQSLAVGTGVSAADGSASVGSYTLGGTGSLTVGNESIGVNNGSGTFRQTGGTHVLQSSSLQLASDTAGSVGTFELAGGTFSNPGVIVGGGGNGTFTHSGGTHTVSGSLLLTPAPAGSSKYALSSTGTLTTTQTIVGPSVSTGGPATFTQSGGRHAVTNDLTLRNAGTYTLSGGSLTAGSLANDATFAQDGGTAQFGPVDGAGSLSVTGGRLTAAHVRQAALAIDGTARVELSPGGGAAATSRVATLTLGLPAATLDLADNALVVDYAGASPLTTIRDRIVTARQGGSWSGPGLTSSAAAANPAATALGYAEAADVLGPAGGTFMGQSVDATTVLVRFTRLGDANLDGTVNFADLLALAKNYNAAASTLGAGGWSRGDFTYDGAVNFADLLALARNYNTAVPADQLPDAPAGFEADLARAFAAVPEPSLLSAAMLGAGLVGFLSRRQRAS